MRFVCDGVIVATPTGSTAYALSVGGPIVAPTVSRACCSCRSAPHTLAQRPFVLGPDDVVEVHVPEPAARRRVRHRRRRSAAVPSSSRRVEVRRGAHEVRLLRPHGGHFYDVVRRKFLGG